jgi:hypothetical protein
MDKATTIQELRSELSEQKAYTAHEQFTARVLMFIAENRINNLERETKELREQIALARKEAVDHAEEVRQMAIDQIPKLQDGKLVFETGDGEGNLVYGHVSADVRPA